nr:hypothetical protein [Anaerofustis stercorihominis]
MTAAVSLTTNCAGNASTNVNRASGRLWLTARSIFPSVPRKRTRLPETAKSLRN